MKKHFSSGGVVLEERSGEVRVLLIKDAYGKWTWPKGHIEPGEAPREAAIREITEEAGLEDLEVLEDLGEQQYFFTLAGDKVFKTVRIFLVRAASGQVPEAQPKEVRETKWFKPDEALALLDYEGATGFVNKGLDMYYKKYLRDHDKRT